MSTTPKIKEETDQTPQKSQYEAEAPSQTSSHSIRSDDFKRNDSGFHDFGNSKNDKDQDVKNWIFSNAEKERYESKILKLENELEEKDKMLFRFKDDLEEKNEQLKQAQENAMITVHL